MVTITDANAGLSASSFRLGTIAKTMLGGGLEDWQVTFGGAAPSYADLIGAPLPGRPTKAWIR